MILRVFLAMPEPIITKLKPETAILIGIIDQDQDATTVEEYLQELAFLTETAGAIPEKWLLQADVRLVRQTYRDAERHRRNQILQCLWPK